MKNQTNGKQASGKRIAGIDAGSNGIRLIISAINERSEIVPVVTERAAVRLGQDAFSIGEFTDRTIQTAVETFEHFHTIIEQHDVSNYRAVATSASREARNGDALVDAIGNACGISLEIIDGLEEAQLILTAIASVIDLTGKSALMVDMGGGSVEVTAVRNGRAVGCETLPFGPVRLLNTLRKQGLSESDVPMILEPYAGSVEELAAAALHLKAPDICIGTGGNLERLGKLRVSLLGKTKPGKIKIGDLESLIPRLLETSIEERMTKLGMRPDRADLICIAAQVLHMVVDEARINRMLVPGMGLKDGLIVQLARQLGVRTKPAASINPTNSVSASASS